MARTVRNAKIDTRSARAKLPTRREPYWTVLAAGRAVGYRRGANGGTWIARFRDDAGRQHYEALGAADDALDNDDPGVIDFAQAQEKARKFFTLKARQAAGGVSSDAGRYTVDQALDDYFTAREGAGAKGMDKARSAAALRIRPTLGALVVEKLTVKQVRDWHRALASASRLSRPKATGKRKEVAVDKNDADAVRARHSTANRTLTILKAALSHAYREGLATSDEAWRKALPFREVDAAVVHFLSEDECRRLVNACQGAFRDLVRAALLTGCRYGELIRMRAADFGAEVGTITVTRSKAGKARHVALTDEGRALFAGLTAGRTGRTLIFLRDDGNPWAASHQQRPLAAACKIAKIEPAATFHILRHTYASALAMKGVPLGVIAAQLGHTDTRMTQKHYAHLAPNYVADTVRAALPNLGIVEVSNVTSLARRA